MNKCYMYHHEYIQNLLSKNCKLLQDSYNSNNINVQSCTIFSMVTYIWSKNVYENAKHQIQGIDLLRGRKVRDEN